MAYFQDVMKDTFVSKKCLIHDNIDSTLSVTLVANTPVRFPCTPDTYEYKSESTYPLWDSLTSKFHNGIDNTILFPKFSLTASGTKGTVVIVRVFVPHPTLGNTLVAEFKDFLAKNNDSERMEFGKWVYTGIDVDAKTHGFYVEVEAMGANVTVTASSAGIGVI